MHITLVVRHFYPFSKPSGVISFIKEFADACIDLEYEVSIVCIRKDGEKSKYTYGGVAVWKFSQGNLFEFRKIMKELDSDVVVFVSSMINTASIVGWWGALRSFMPKVKTVYYQATNVSNIVGGWPFRVLMRSFDKVVCSNQSTVTKFKEVLGMSIELIHSGVVLGRYDEYYNSRKGRIKDRENRGQRMEVGFFGHLVYLKGADLVVEVARRMKELEFVLVAGDDRGKSKTQFQLDVEKEISKRSNVRRVGFIDNPLDEMVKCDIVVLPYREGATILGVAQSAIEAMAMGIPVIGTDNSALRDILKDGTNGFVCSKISEIERRIRQLTTDPKLYSRLSLEARKTVVSSFNIKDKVDNLIRV